MIKPVDQELFNSSAPRWNCVDFPGEGTHYLNSAGGCRWCGRTRQQITQERIETSTEGKS